MDDSIQGLLILAVISVLSALVWHSFSKSYSAHIGTVVTSVATFQIVAYFYTGYLDPFYQIAIVISGFVALIISFVVKDMITKTKRDGPIE